MATSLKKQQQKPGLFARLSEGKKDKLITNTNLALMCLPGLAMLLVFNYLPMFGLVIAFKDYRFAKGILAVNGWVFVTSVLSSVVPVQDGGSYGIPSCTILYFFSRV